MFIILVNEAHMSTSCELSIMTMAKPLILYMNHHWQLIAHVHALSEGEYNLSPLMCVNCAITIKSISDCILHSITIQN